MTNAAVFRGNASRLAHPASGLTDDSAEPDGVDDFLVGRKTVGCRLGKGQAAIDFDFEHTAPGLDQIDLSRWVGFENQFSRLTGAWSVISLPAVFDLDFHGGLLTRQLIVQLE